MNTANINGFGDKAFNFLNNIFMGLLIVLTIYPFWHIVMYSLSDTSLAAKGGLFLYPRGFSLDTYQQVLSNVMVIRGFFVSVFVTVFGSIAGQLITAMMAYPLSKKRLHGRTIINFLMFFTMLFSGGMVPSYLLIRSLNLIDTIWALILPGMVSAWNVFLVRNFFSNIPESLDESAKIDGANDFIVFFKIILPLSKPVMCTTLLFTAVGYWNNYFSTVLYINNVKLWSLQAVLRDIVSNASAAMERQGVNIANQVSITPQTVMMAAVVVATLPILLVYPFIQKYFIHGVMVGSVKG